MLVWYVAVRMMSAPASTNAVWTLRRVVGSVRSKWEDQRGVSAVKWTLCGGASKVVPRPPSRKSRGVAMLWNGEWDGGGILARSWREFQKERRAFATLLSFC